MIKIEYVDIKKLREHPDNPRNIQSEDFQQLCQSIKDNPEFFEVRPILARLDGTVFAGNQRLKAAQHLGLSKVPAALMDVTEEKEKEFMIRDNVANGEWDFELLSEYFDMEDLLNWGVDMPKINIDDFADNKELDVDELTQDLNQTCPKCGFEFEGKE